MVSSLQSKSNEIRAFPIDDKIGCADISETTTRSTLAKRTRLCRWLAFGRKVRAIFFI